MTEPMRTGVAIIGAGPSGLLLSHLLAQHGIESIVLERRTRDYVNARVRAGILEESSLEVLRRHGLGDRVSRDGIPHRGIHLHWPGQRHHLDFVDLTGRHVWVYGQTELQRDLDSASRARDQQVHYEVRDVILAELDGDRPTVGFTDRDGVPRRILARAVAGCDGTQGVSRTALGDQHRSWSRRYPYSWLGVRADVAPSTDELIYAWSPDGFALHSMRSPTVSRFYLQVPNDTDLGDWPDDRVWTELRHRLGHGENGWRLADGPVTEKSVLPMQSLVQAPMRRGRLFLAGDAAHTVPPTGAKGLNLAIADVARLAPALTDLLAGDDRAAVRYSDLALARVWRCTHFSWWMTTMLHATGDDFDAQLQLSQLRWVTSSRAAATGLAENYAGLPLEG